MEPYFVQSSISHSQKNDSLIATILWKIMTPVGTYTSTENRSILDLNGNLANHSNTVNTNFKKIPLEVDLIRKII